MATPEMVEDVLRARDVEFMSAKKRRALETVSSQDEYQQTVVSSADGAKVINNLDSLAKEYQENTVTHKKLSWERLQKRLVLRSMEAIVNMLHLKQ